jgi:hypothetical protein
MYVSKEIVGVNKQNRCKQWMMMLATKTAVKVGQGSAAALSEEIENI